MKAVSRLERMAVAALGFIAVLSCSLLRPGGESGGSGFMARQYLERGRAALTTGNDANARFLIGRAVELDPSSSEALALWEANWPADSLPPAALAALRERSASSATDEDGEASSERPEASRPAGAAHDGGSGDPTAPGATRATGAASRPEPGPAVPDATPVGGADAARPVASSGAPSGPSSGAGGGAASPAVSIDVAPVEVPPPLDVSAVRSRFDAAFVAGDGAALRRAGAELLAARRHHLPDVYEVLSAWVEARVDPRATEARVRDILGSLEFGDRSYLAGKPPDVEEARWLRAYRGRFLDLLGWSAYLRGDMGQAEAALRSAETEINLRGRGDVSHLRHLAAFYERRGDLAKAESYAIAAAARDETDSGTLRTLARRLWTRRHGSPAGLESRLQAERRRADREERSAAIAGRLYAPLPSFSAVRAGGTRFTDESLRDRVTVLIFWRPGCEDCLRLLRDLPAALPGGAQETSGGRGRAPVETLALDLSTEPAPEPASPVPGPGVSVARPEKPQALANSLAVTLLPITLVVEPAGFVQYRHLGYPAAGPARERWLDRLGWQIESLRSLTSEPRPPTARTRAPSSRR